MIPTITAKGMSLEYTLASKKRAQKSCSSIFVTALLSSFSTACASTKEMRSRVVELACKPLMHYFSTPNQQELRQILDRSSSARDSFCGELRKIFSERLPKECIAGRVSHAFKAFQDTVDLGSSKLNDFFSKKEHVNRLLAYGFTEYDLSTTEWNTLIHELGPLTVQYINSLMLEVKVGQLTCITQGIAERLNISTAGISE